MLGLVAVDGPGEEGAKQHVHEAVSAAGKGRSLHTWACAPKRDTGT